MSRILARSATADLLARLFDQVLFLAMLPLVLILARRSGIDTLHPEPPRSATGRRLPKAA